MKFVFKNDNGIDYFLVAGGANRALLRDMRSGAYIIARGLDVDRMCGSWSGGSYFSADEFREVIEIFQRGGKEEA